MLYVVSCIIYRLLSSKFFDGLFYFVLQAAEVLCEYYGSTTLTEESAILHVYCTLHGFMVIIVIQIILKKIRHIKFLAEHFRMDAITICTAVERYIIDLSFTIWIIVAFVAKYLFAVFATSFLSLYFKHFQFDTT